MSVAHARDPGGRGRAPSGYRVPLARPRPAPAPTVPLSPRSSGWTLLGLLLILGSLAWFAIEAWVNGGDTASGLIAAPILVVVTLLLMRRSLAREQSFDLSGLVLTSIGLHLVAAYPRFLSATDSIVYNREGARLAVSFRSLDFTGVDVGTGAPVPGTGALRYIAGLVQVTTGSTFFASTLVFSFLSLWGCWFFYLAFRRAVPDGSHRRYAMLILLWPSLLYWPSSMGKDSWMLVTVGLASLGAAHLLTRTRGGWLMLTAGLGLGALVRPHVSLITFVAVLIAFLVGRRETRRVPGEVSLGGLTKAIGVLVLLVGGALLAPATASVLKVDDLSTTSVNTALQQTQEQTSEGGSAFRPVNANSPIGYPVAVFTVLFRPLPAEVDSVSGLLTSIEGLLLLVLAATSWRRAWGAMRRLRREPYVTFALAYIAMFAYAFAAIANFGILSRQRVQVLPLVFVLLALPAAHRGDPEPLPAAPEPGEAEAAARPSPLVLGQHRR